MAPNRDLHWVNADNKQTVVSVLNTYKKMGVRAAGVVDIDVVNDAAEFAQQLDALGIVAQEREDLIAARKRIEAEIKAVPLATLLMDISTELERMKTGLDRVRAGSQEEQERAIRQVRRSAGELREKASVWHVLKMSGRAALSAAATDFDLISAAFRRRGLFINAAGELEASLGPALPWRTNKRKWFEEAMVTRVVLASILKELSNEANATSPCEPAPNRPRGGTALDID